MTSLFVHHAPRKYLLFSLLILTLSQAASPLARAQEEPTIDYERIEDVVYGRKYGMALTMDVFIPTATNAHLGLVFLVSGGWYSAKAAINPDWMKPFLKRGYTVFAVMHGSQPRFIIPEIIEDIHRAVRFIRHRASDYHIAPHRLGIMGASAGGHLTLTLATQGGPGRLDAKDPVDRENSAVQAAACFFPPTDFLNYGAVGVDAVGVGVLAAFQTAFGSRTNSVESRQKYGREISPIYFVHSNMPPVLIVHGDADKLVPIQQAESFLEKCQEVSVTTHLIRREGQAHGWADIARDLEILANWFDRYLPKTDAQANGEADP